MARFDFKPEPVGVDDGVPHAAERTVDRHWLGQPVDGHLGEFS
jgi:hypothetical protein